MATERQIEANRRNAQRSTGPRTEAGKSISRRNALWHGMSAQQMLLDGESLEESDQLFESLYQQFVPQNALEEELVHRLTDTLWRLRRAPVFEAAILNWKKHHLKATREDVHPNRERERKNATGWFKPEPLLPEPGHIRADQADIILGRALDAALTQDLFGKLARHEGHLMRQVERITDQLRKLRNEPWGPDEDYGSSVASQQGGKIVGPKAAPSVRLLIADLFEKAKALNIAQVEPLAQPPGLTPSAAAPTQQDANKSS